MTRGNHFGTTTTTKRATGATRTRRVAFTLVELLVVITIIGMLTGMIFPAVNAAREAGRKAVCSNNQHQLAVAMLNYEGQNGQFPGYVGRLGNSTSNYMEGTWVVMLLPYLDRGDLWAIWSQGWDGSSFTTTGSLAYNRSRYLEFMICPSDPPDEQGTMDTPMSYVVNGGRDGLDTATNRLAYGVFHNNGFNATNQSSPVRLDEARSTLEYISTHDGAAYTLMLAENCNAGYWGNNTVRYYTTVLSGGNRTYSERAVSFNWNTTVPSNAGTVSSVAPNTINGDKRWINTAPATWTSARVRPPSSLHPGGAIATFCDGHQKFLRESMNYIAYWHIMTPCSKLAGSGAGGNALILTNTTLSDADLD